jgi:hypothetical protein
MVTPFTLDVIIYADELAYFKGASLAAFRDRKYRKTWAHIQRWLTLWTALAAVAIIPIATQAYV